MIKALQPAMIDPFGRRITYLRVSVTDRCDFRCVYCMAESTTFLPRKDLLTLEEIDRLVSAFIAKGVRKVRLTGGEPLVRKNLMWLIMSLSRHIGAGLDELTLTTNGSQLTRYAKPLADSGVARINVSLDTLDVAKFKAITRWGDFAQVMDGIDAADRAGIKIKINTVALRGVNEDEIEALVRWTHGRGFDLTLIETMPMGDTGERPHRAISAALTRAGAASGAFHTGRHLLSLGRSGSLRARRRDRRHARLHHPAHPQFLRSVQSRAGDLHRHSLYVPRPGGRRRSPGATPGKRVGPSAQCGDRRGHRRQAQGP